MRTNEFKQNAQLLPSPIRAMQTMYEWNADIAQMQVKKFKHVPCDYAIASRVTDKDLHLIFPPTYSNQIATSATTSTAYNHMEWLIAESSTRR